MINRWNSPKGMIHITGKLKVPADTGCEYYSNCLSCPFLKCQLEMTLRERKQLHHLKAMREASRIKG